MTSHRSRCGETRRGPRRRMPSRAIRDMSAEISTRIPRPAMLPIAVAAAAAMILALPSPGIAAASHSTPSGSTSAQDTVDRLEREGYQVIVNKIGHGSLDQCAATAVRHGNEVFDTGVSRNTGSPPTRVLRYTTVYVDVQCQQP